MFEMLEIIKTIVLFISLALSAWIDWKKQQVSLLLTAIVGIIGILCAFFEKTNFLLGMTVGAVLLLIGMCTKESVGYGDGCLFLMTGIFLDFWENLSLLLFASVFAAVTAAGSLCLKRKNKKDRIAFVPFVFFAYITLVGFSFAKNIGSAAILQ